jgi:thioredoxin-like negative regulator of GroEL
MRVKIDDKPNIMEKYSVEVLPTVLFFEKGSVSKRLDGVAGLGLNEKQLTDLITQCGINIE